MLTNLRRSLRHVLSKPTLFHLRLQLPLTQKRTEQALAAIHAARDVQADTLAVSILASGADNKAQFQKIEDALLSTAEYIRSPIYTFIEDIATTEGYRFATIGSEISATPYSVIGEVGAFKSYRNLTKLLQKLGIRVDLLTKNQKPLWSSVTEKNPNEQAFTEGYLKTLEKQTLKTISSRRGIDPSVLQGIRGKLLTAKQALSLKLIDKIRTFSEFQQTHYPNHLLRQFTFNKSFPLLKLSAFEQDTFNGIIEAAEMNAKPLYYLTNNQELLDRLSTVVQNRLNEPEFLEYLDSELCPQVLQFLEEQQPVLVY